MYSNGFFFVQTILADRYILRRRVETGIIRIKKIFFLIFNFYSELSRFKLLRKVGNSVYSHFS